MSDIKKQLWENQLWETVAFMAKAAFLFVLTPLMLKKWGSAGYGEFAIASSVVVFVSMFDLGLRGRARVELCEAVALGKHARGSHVLAQAIRRFALISVVALCLVLAIAWMGICSRILGLPQGSDGLITITAGATLIYMLSGFFVEPLVAEGRIGMLKLATAGASVVALPCVWLVLYFGGGVALAVIAWLGCLIAGNLLVAVSTGQLNGMLDWPWAAASTVEGCETFFSGLWFNLTNVAWLMKGHGLTFLISFLSGPAIAGEFFIILRLSEIIGSFGAISSEVTLGTMAGVDLGIRQRNFATAYRYCVVLCLLLGLGIGFLTPVFWVFWLKDVAPLGWATGWLAASLGFASGLNRLITFSSMGLGLIHRAAFWCSFEAGITFCGVFLVQKTFGLQGSLLIATASAVCLYPIARGISEKLGQSIWHTWRPRLWAERTGL